MHLAKLQAWQFTLVAALLLTLVGCAGGSNRPGPGTTSGVQSVALTPAQALLIDNGVKQMVGSQNAQLSAVKATRLPDKVGVHVCGYVSKKQPNGKDGPSLPFYIELREADGKPVTERGQVGSDPSKLSKVNFVCRHNN